MISELGKVRISIPVSFTTLTGYILSQGSIDRGIVLPVLGIFLLACGASALNQIQEMTVDMRMKRTKNRPLPAGRISLAGAWWITVFFFLSGSVTLLAGPGLLTLAIGLATFVWYNAIYTPLKKVTAFAAVPGSMVGALPPLAGWIAGGGDLLDFRALVLTFFFFIGQIPHFWLLLLKFGEQYEDAELPSLTRLLNPDQIKRITFTWIASMGVVAIGIPAFGLITQQFTSYIVMLISLLLVIYFLPLLRSGNTFKAGKSFILINLYYLLIMLLMITDKLV